MSEEATIEKKPVDIKHKQQLAIKTMNDFTYSLLYGGSRSGKSFIIMFMMLITANKYKCRQLIVRFHFTDVKKSIIHETLPEVAAMLGITYHLNQQDWFITLPNGAEIWFGGIDEGRGLDRVLGKQYLNIWFNEASDIAYDAYTTVLTRLAERVLRIDRNAKPVYKKKPDGTWLLTEKGGKIRDEVRNHAFIDENPPKKSHWTYKLFFDNIEPESRTLLDNADEYGVMQLNPGDNAENISEGYLKRLEAMPPKQRKRFLLGEFSDDISGALFTEACINRNRRIQHPYLKQVVISIDPATTSKSTSDETGITVEGKDENDRGYLLEDRSGIYKPNEWAEIAVKLFFKWDADFIVAEINQGGEMVKATINNHNRNVPVKTVHATKGKMLRAEPISFLYEEDLISHVGAFPDAEDEMVSFTGAEGEKSPNRLDSIVHGFTFLFPVGKSAEAEYFNRDKVRYFEKINLADGENIGYINISDSDNYSFTMLCLKIKDKKVFQTEVLFNDYMPSGNIKAITDMISRNSLETVFVECSMAYSPFVRELNSLDLTTIRGVKAMPEEENRILIESNFIVEKFLFLKEPESIQYKDFMRQLHSYTSVSEKDERFAPAALAGISKILKKLYQDNL